MPRRCAAALLGPLWEGAVGAADWGREKRVASLPPSALRADTSLAEGGEEKRIPTPVCGLPRNDTGGTSRTPSPTRGSTYRPVGRGPCAPPKNAYPAAGHMGPALQRKRIPAKTTRCPLRGAVPYGRGDVGIVPYRAAAGCPLQAQVAGHAGHGAAADADGHGAVPFIQDAAYL